jgi:hypothetical protein
MFIGHFAVGFAAKRLAPKTSLGWLIAAPMFCDMLWPLFLLLGIEHTEIAPGYTAFTPLNLYDIPWSHSTVMVVLWSALFAGVYFALRKDARGAAVLAVGVFSHWVLDVLTHRPEMQWYPGGAHVLGLELWASVPGTVIAEVALMVVGVAIYVRTTKPRDRRGTISFVAFVALLGIAYVSDVLGPPPPSWQIVMWVAFGSFLLVPWAWSFDRHRELRATGV